MEILEKHLLCKYKIILNAYLSSDYLLDEAHEEGMRFEHGARIFGMVLHADIPVVGRHLDSLDESVLRIEAYAAHACGLEVVAEVIVELIAMAMAFDNLVCAIRLSHLAATDEQAFISSKSHSAAHVGDVLLFFHDVNDIIGCVLIHLTAVGIREVEHVAGILYDHNLHAEADAECGDIVFATILGCKDFAFYASVAKAWADDDAIALRDLLTYILSRKVLAIDKGEGCAAILVGGSMGERFMDGYVCVL